MEMEMEKLGLYMVYWQDRILIRTVIIATVVAVIGSSQLLQSRDWYKSGKSEVTELYISFMGFEPGGRRAHERNYE